MYATPDMAADAQVVLRGDPVTSVAAYRARGGGEGLRVARALGPWRTAEEVTLSGLRGRGGGGFRTGRKWLAVLVNARDSEQRFVVANGAEGEPGTFKDRAILRHNPYQVIEGLAIAALAVGASRAFLAVKASFTREVEILRQALIEMRGVGLAGDVPIRLVRGPDSYLFGEEKALLEVSRARTLCRAVTRPTCTACSPLDRRWAGRPTTAATRAERPPTPPS